MSKRADILGATKNSLSFFALVVLVGEAFLGAIALTLPDTLKFVLGLLMVFILFLVIGAVIVITVKWPRHLLNQVNEELERARLLEELISSQGFGDVIDERVEQAITRHREEEGGEQNDAI